MRYVLSLAFLCESRDPVFNESIKSGPEDLGRDLFFLTGRARSSVHLLVSDNTGNEPVLVLDGRRRDASRN